MTQTGGWAHVPGQGFACDFLKELGEGPLGAVWLARTASGGEAGRLITVRRVPLARLDRDAQARIEAAALQSATLVHPSLAKVLRTRRVGEELWIIGEYIEGVCVDALRRMAIHRRTPLPSAVAVRIVHDAIQVISRVREQLALAGRRRLLYAEGVVVASFGETLLSDTGVLAELAALPSALQESSLIAQLSPEEVSTGCGDGRSEVFAAGVLLWELLANRRHFARDTFEATRRSVVDDGDVPRLHAIERCGSAVPDAIAHIVTRATARDPAKRFASLNELEHALGDSTLEWLASDDEVTRAVDAVCGPFLSACRRSAQLPKDYHLRKGGAEDVAPEVASLNPAAAGGFPAEEGPTLPARHLVHSDAASGTPLRLESSQPPPSEAKGISFRASESLGTSASSQVVSIARLALPKRLLWAAGIGVSLVVLVVLVIASRGSIRVASAPDSWAPPTGAPPGPARSAPVTLATPSRATQAAPPPASTSMRSERSSQAALDASPAGTATRDASVAVESEGLPAEPSSPSVNTPRKARETYRPRGIKPYRPRGI